MKIATLRDLRAEAQAINAREQGRPTDRHGDLCRLADMADAAQADLPAGLARSLWAAGCWALRRAANCCASTPANPHG